MAPKVFLSAFLTRLIFMLHSVVVVWRVTILKNDKIYWLLALFNVLLCIEMVLTLKLNKGKGLKWFSPPMFFYLLANVPSLWLLEINADLRPCENNTTIVSDATYTDIIQMGIHILQLINEICQSVWTLILHQTFLLILIIGKWLLPSGGSGITRGQLSQLLLLFVGTAADISEFFCQTLELTIIRSNTTLVYFILGVWTWSMLQFPLDVAVHNIGSEQRSPRKKNFCQQLCMHSADICSIVISLLIQDGPFLISRIILMTYLQITGHMVFFILKNSLIVLLKLYRFVAILVDVYAENPEAEHKMTEECHQCDDPEGTATSDKSHFQHRNDALPIIEPRATARAPLPRRLTI